MRIKLINIIALLSLMLIFSFDLSAHYIIVNNSNPIKKISKGELKNIFLGNKVSWNNNKRIQIVDYNAESDLREEFSTDFLNMTPNKVSMIWLKVTLSGKVAPPKIFFKERDVIKYINDNPEAIGYISNKSDLPSDIRVIEVNS